MIRRAFLALCGAFATSLALAAPPHDSRANREDFDAMWRAIDQDYPYFDGKRAAWKRVGDLWRARAGAAKSRAEFVRALEAAIATLRDDSVTLSEHSSLRVVPAEIDIWAEWQDETAVVTSVRVSSDADVAGLRPGHIVMNVDGVPVDLAVRERLGRTGATGNSARDWALRQVLAGPRSGILRLTVRDSRGPSYLEIGRKKVPPMATPPLIARRMGDERDIGYIRIKDSLADAHLAEAFDGALNYVRDARALILDLRETSGRGDRAVTDAILARFANGNAAYASRVLVLIDRWTAGEGEALAAKLAESARATLVGTPTAGIHGEPGEVTLPHSGIVVRFPTQKTTREGVTPAVEVNLAAPSGGPGDPILYQALKLAERR